LDGFPLYWVEKPNLQKPRCLEDLPSQEREVCNLLSGLQSPFNTVELHKLEFSSKALKGYTGTLFDFALTCLLAYCVGLASYALLFSCAGMVLNAEKIGC